MAISIPNDVLPTLLAHLVLGLKQRHCPHQGNMKMAENFSALAEQDNGTCDFESTCVGDVESNGAVTASDLLALLASFGQYCN